MCKLIQIIFLLISSLFFAQNSLYTDSIDISLKELKNDTAKINFLYRSFHKEESNNSVYALELAKKAVRLSEITDYNLDKSYQALALAYKNTAEYKKSLEIYFKAEKHSANYKSPKKEKALANIYDGMASVYSRLQNHAAAISSLKKAISIVEALKDENEIARYHVNIGNHYFNSNQLDEAISHYSISEKAYLSLKDSTNLIYVFNGFGNAYYEMKDYKRALEYFQKFYEFILKFTPDDKSNIAIAFENIGETSSKMGNYELGLVNCLKAAELFREIDDKTSLYITYENIARMYALQNNYQKSNEYFQKYVNLKDSVFDEDTKNTIHEMSIKYESDKKEKENQVLTLGNKNKQLLIYFALGGCILLSVLAFFIFRSYNTKRKANKELEEKNIIIHQQKTIVEEQHKDIKDSIKYAQRIQGAILPPKNKWDKILPNSFLLYMPKDILSGDFYWVEENKDYIYIAAADCTGHGVPGALISIVNFNLLNKAVLEKGLVTPSEILDAVNLWLTESLHQTYGESAVRDGMDVALIAIHKHSNEILFAGANNPIYHVSNGQLTQIKADKFPVGAFIEDKIQNFTTRRFKVQQGDCVYLFSDGYADQFGGDKGKKYKYSPFQEKLKNIYNLPLPSQRDIMKQEFLKWKGSHEQVDDVLLIGIKIA
ncbi:MAG: protein serine/threonine phosphatase [Bacteroidetes bacterium]|jgi:serine phosphatase RsbU (regulator of sigma subunit)|nr:protein serine/threonine phosphatase [Bacteroidota bacterium]MDF2453124.1 protein serine/threonine phosphatase [Bacteroidota bacterium]